MLFVIRAASADDGPDMHRVRNKMRENRVSTPERVTEASYLPYVKAGSIWVAETRTGIVGFAALDAAEKRVWALFVDPDAEGAGIGRALHQRMLDWAHEHGLSRLTLSTDKTTRAARFCERAGWTEAGTSGDGEALFEIALPK